MGRTGRALLACALAVVVLAPGTAFGAERHPRRAIAELPAVPSDSVVDSYGVGIHLNFLDTPYRDTDVVADALAGLGVRHVRDDLYLDAPRQYRAIARVAARGVGFDLIMGRPGAGTPADYVSTVADELPAGAVESLEGANEWDLFGGDGWVGEVRTWQQDLYAAAKADDATADLPVLAPALAFRWNYADLGDVSPAADLANAHMYPGGYEPSNEIGAITRAVRQSMATQPLVTTEAGYTNALGSTGSHRPVPEDVAGAYYPRLLLEHVARGEQRVYSYELIDSFDDPDTTNPEAHFGLLRHDLSPKPAYTAMQNLLALLDDPGPSFIPEPLAVTADGLSGDARYLLTERRDGGYVLLLWRDVRIWDPVQQQRLPVTPDRATVRLDVPHTLTVYRPTDGADPVRQRVGTSVPVELDGQVTAIAIDAAEPPVVPGTPPGAPTVRRVDPGKGRVTVVWRAADGHGRPVTAYRLRAGGRTVTVGGSATRATIRRLAHGKRLRVTVQARNDVGWGPKVRTRAVRVR
ncbi:MAG TPA: fibronectin type III domain-containing protein [Nocardioides sp.]|nr:fibronectin type III domain-containing protein [Nocardioides sp.]